MPFPVSALRVRSGLALGLLLLTVGLWLSGCNGLPGAGYFRGVATEGFTIPLDSDRSLAAYLYYPEAGSFESETLPYATVMLWHGVSSTKEMMEPLAIELARQGIAALTIDSGGFGESYDRPYSEADNLTDARAVATYVKAHPERFDGDRLGIGGHSMGGATALRLASEDSQLKVTLVLGMSADITPILPSNLWMGIGLYEEFHTPYAMRQMLEQGTLQAATEGRLYGDFARGTARKLIISPTSDHLIEPFDPTLIQEAVAWARQGFAIGQPSRPLLVSGVIIAYSLITIGGGLTLSYLIGKQPWAQHHYWGVAFSLGAIALLILLAGMRGYLAPRLTTEVILLAALLLPLTNYAVRSPSLAHFTAVLRLIGLYLVAIVLAYSGVAIALRSDELLAHPVFFLGLPQFMVQLPLSLAYSRFCEWRAALFTLYRQAVLPTGWLLWLFLPELVRPGLLFAIAVHRCPFLVKWLRQPLHIQWQTSPSRSSILLVGGLLGLLGVLVYYQSQAGLLSLPALQATAMLLLQMTFLPTILLIVMLRSPYLQRLEQWCINGKSPSSQERDQV